MKIPVVIIGGFLGSGKTTLLIRLLKQSLQLGLQPGILMNELGKQDVDGYLLEEHAGLPVNRLLDGCVCCSRKEEVDGCLADLLAQKPDVLFIEPTGVADPGELAEIIRAPRWRNRLELLHLLTVLDAEHALDYASLFSADRHLVRTLGSQLAVSDWVVINKTDLCGPDRLGKTQAMVRRRNPDAQVVLTVRGEFDSRPLLDGIRKREPELEAPGIHKRDSGQNAAGIRREPEQEPPGTRKQESGQNTAGIRRAPEGFSPSVLVRSGQAAEPAVSAEAASYSAVSAVTLTLPEGVRLSTAELERFLLAQGEALLRAKGHLPLTGSQGDIQLVQFAGGRAAYEPSRYPGSPYLVCIGLSLDPAALSREWSALRLGPE